MLHKADRKAFKEVKESEDEGGEGVAKDYTLEQLLQLERQHCDGRTVHLQVFRQQWATHLDEPAVLHGLVAQDVGDQVRARQWRVAVHCPRDELRRNTTWLCSTGSGRG